MAAPRFHIEGRHPNWSHVHVAHAGERIPTEALDFIGRQHQRLETGAGYAFCVADLGDGRALGTADLAAGGLRPCVLAKSISDSIRRVTHDFERFLTAQNSHGSYEQALAELRRGRKTSHWMWFVFPQIAGLGRSEMARAYAIADLDEAKAYLDHPVLGPRLVTAAESVLTHRNRTAEQIMGGIDGVKLRSSMTLFAHADPGQTIFRTVLDCFFDGDEDPATLARL